MSRLIQILIAICIASTFVSCNSNAQRSTGDTNDDLTKYAKYLSLIDHGNYIEANIADPWHKDKNLGRYALVKSDTDAEIPDELTILHVPLQRSIVYSSVHTAAIDELGAIANIAGVADANYFTDGDKISSLLTAGKIADIGSSMSPAIEKIIDLNADALLLSPWENGNLAGVERAGVPLIMMADYLEPTPLGRAEWIRLIGHLYGAEQQADSIFESVCFYYKALSAAAANSGSANPTVLTEKPYSGVWYVPGGASYMARMLRDAGAVYPWADDNSTGSLPLDEAAVIGRASDATFWLIKDDTNHTPESLLASMPHAKAFKAFPNGVYVCNTQTTSIFRDIAFHPDRILADFVNIFHPNCISNTQLTYFQPIDR